MDKPKALNMWTVARNLDDLSKTIWYGSFSELVEEEEERRRRRALEDMLNFEG